MYNEKIYKYSCSLIESNIRIAKFNTYGTRKADGTCNCDTGYTGDQCQYSRNITCNIRKSK